MIGLNASLPHSTYSEILFIPDINKPVLYQMYSTYVYTELDNIKVNSGAIEV